MYGEGLNAILNHGNAQFLLRTRPTYFKLLHTYIHTSLLKTDWQNAIIQSQ